MVKAAFQKRSKATDRVIGYLSYSSIHQLFYDGQTSAKILTVGKKNKETRRLRAQVEFLKAQLKTQAGASSWREGASASAASTSPAKETKAYPLPPTLLRQDLRKTFLLTLGASLFLAVAYLTQNYWPLLGTTALNIMKRG
jgi:hypothetical protein